MLAGAVNATVAVVEPVAVAVPIVGAPGTAAATADVALELAETAATMTPQEMAQMRQYSE